MLSFFPRDILDEILDLIESVYEGFPTYFYLFTDVVKLVTSLFFIHLYTCIYNTVFINISVRGNVIQLVIFVYLLVCFKYILRFHSTFNQRQCNSVIFVYLLLVCFICF